MKSSANSCPSGWRSTRPVSRSLNSAAIQMPRRLATISMVPTSSARSFVSRSPGDERDGVEASGADMVGEEVETADTAPPLSGREEEAEDGASEVAAAADTTTTMEGETTDPDMEEEVVTIAEEGVETTAGEAEEAGRMGSGRGAGITFGEGEGAEDGDMRMEEGTGSDRGRQPVDLGTSVELTRVFIL